MRIWASRPVPASDRTRPRICPRERLRPGSGRFRVGSGPRRDRLRRRLVARGLGVNRIDWPIVLAQSETPVGTDVDRGEVRVLPTNTCTPGGTLASVVVTSPVSVTVAGGGSLVRVGWFRRRPPVPCEWRIPKRYESPSQIATRGGTGTSADVGISGGRALGATSPRSRRIVRRARCAFRPRCAEATATTVVPLTREELAAGFGESLHPAPAEHAADAQQDLVERADLQRQAIAVAQARGIGCRARASIDAIPEVCGEPQRQPSAA